MSVYTEADVHVREAKEHITKALESLNSVVVLRCSGWADFAPEYRKKISEAHATLMKLRDEIE